MNQINHPHTYKDFKQSIQQLNQVIKEYPPPIALQGIVNIMTSFSVICSDRLVGFGDRTCDQFLKLNNNSVAIANLGKDEEIQVIVNKFLAYPHHQQLQINSENEPAMKKYRSIISNYFHELIHNVTSKSLVKLSVLFYKLLSLQMLDTQIVNYFFLMLIISYEKLTSNRELKIIKSFLRNLYQKSIIYIGVKTEDNPNRKKKGVKKIPINSHLYESSVQYNNCFTILTYIIYFGNMSHKASQDLILFDKQMLQKLFAFPMQISSLILAFRNQYPQSLILACDRNLPSLSECIVDSTLLKSLLRIYLDFKFDATAKDNLYAVIQNLVKFSLTVQTAKNMIKVLEISDTEHLEEKWKKMFMVLKMSLPPPPKEIITAQQIKSEIKLDSPTKTREQISWNALQKSTISPKNTDRLKKQMDVLILAKDSFLKFNFQHEFNGFLLNFNSYRTCGQFILTKLINQDKEIWLIIRHLGSHQFQIEAMTTTQNNVSVNKIQVSWDPFQTHTMICTAKGDQIHFQFSQGQVSETQSQTEINTSRLNAKNIKPKQVQLGTLDNSIPCYFSEIHSFDIFYCQGKNSLNYIKHQKNKLRQTSKKVYILTKNSLIQILRKLGDLDLFFLLVSHLVRKVDDDSALKMMLKEVIDFLQLLVVVKGVHGIKLTDQMKQHRFYNVRCLVWLASKYKRDPDSILQIFRLIEIRGIKRPLECLQILSNIGLWKQIPQKNHYKLLQKIKQACFQINTDSLGQMLEMMKKIILDYMIFYRNNQLLSQNLQYEYLLKHSQILKLVFDIVASQNVLAILGFIEFLLKILYILLDRTKNSDFIDTTIGFQLALLTFRLLMTARQVQFKSQRDKSKGISKKPAMKMTKTGLQSMKSMNILVSTHVQKDDDLFLMRIEETLSWAGQILYCLNNQILHADQKIKYYDWQWDEKLIDNSSSYTQKKGFINQKKKHKLVQETEIVKICERISMGLLSFDRNTFNLFNLCEFQGARAQIFWQMNLFDEKTSFERFFDTIRLGYFETIPWTDQKIISVLQRSFDISENSISINLPERFIESMRAKDSSLIHNSLLGIYYDKFQQNNAIEKQKCSQKIMYIISILPESVYSNTQLLREELRKQKRNAKIVDLVQKHLIIKELAKEGFKVMNHNKTPQKQELISTIVAFENASGEKVQSSQKLNLTVSQQTEEVQSKRSKQRKDSEDIAVFSDYQESFSEVPQGLNQNFQGISSEKVKQSLEHLRLLANPSEMETFYKVSVHSQNKKQSRELLQGHITNFNLHIDAIIKIFEQNSKPNKISQLQTEIFFIQKHLYAFSKMIMSEFLFKDTKQIKVQEEITKGRRKKSFQTASNLKFKQVAETMLDEFLRNRRRSVYKMENVWYNVQKNNKDFWQIFFKPERKNQSVDLACNSLKLRGLIKVDQQKRQIQLPKNMTISNKFSISGDSEKDDPHNGQQSLLFEDSSFYQQQQGSESDRQDMEKHPVNMKQKAYNQHLAKKKRRRDNQFQVSYITTTSIYQGLILCQNNAIKFVQNMIPNQNFYDLICANQNEQRTTFQIQKKRQKFQVVLNERSTIIPKRYLYHDAAVQVFSEKRTYFFLFGKGSQREQFLKMHSHLKGTIQSQGQLLQAAQRQMERWVNGDISNYTYLMHLNDLSGRTFNDMSQYYIFPWVLTNYKAQKFNKNFLNNTSNYRDLSKPVGALNPKRYDELENRFKQTTKYQQNQGYLYGSFCSNPAIVCNFLVRLEPFSMHHYLLQSKQFDLADRIFYSISNQFNCCYTNVGDYKELIPEFYSCPEFLRNRNKYKFGEKQNKQVVNNVELPEWALYQFKNKKAKSVEQKSQAFLPEEQFVFRMRKCLQSDYVTKNINFWIDLIFGVYNRKEKAMERSNLYMPNIYKNQLKKSGSKNKQTLLIFFKQFGQIPRDLFQRDHKPYKNSRVYYRLFDSQSHLVSQMEQKQGENKKYYADFRFFISWTQHMINIMDIKHKTGLIDRTQNSITEIPLKNEQLNSIKIITTESETEQSKKIDLLIYLKSGKLRVREMSISTFRKKLEIKDEKQDFFSIDTQFRLMQIYEQQKFLIFACHNSIKIYQYSLQANASQKSGDSMFGSGRFQMFTNPSDQSLKFFINKKLELKLTKKFEFTQHRSRVQHICVCQSYGLLISIDSNRKAYILKINSKEIEVVQYFRLKKLTNCQNITQIQIHEMGYIIMLTSLNNIHVYNFMGDYVAGFKGSLLKDLNSKMYKKIQSSFQSSKINSEISQQNTRKKSGNDINTDKLITCQFEESDPENSSNITSIMIEQETTQKKYHSTIPTQKQQKQKHNRKCSAQIQQEEQIITSFKIWNHESLELIIGTNVGCIYRIDLYMIDDCEKIDLNNATYTKKKEKLKVGKNLERENTSNVDFISVNRIGRHWQCWISSGLGLFKMESEDYRNADKRQEQYKKKSVIE